jgi:hypothetical protein
MKKFKCKLCGRSKFDKPYEPHNCISGFRKKLPTFEQIESEIDSIKTMYEHTTEGTDPPTNAEVGDVLRKESFEETVDFINENRCGLYDKYQVIRRDGSSNPGRKHENCFYFVLDMDHDPYAIPALKTYIHHCKDNYPDLAKDLEIMLMKRETVKYPVQIEIPKSAQKILYIGGDFSETGGLDSEECDTYYHYLRELTCAKITFINGGFLEYLDIIDLNYFDMVFWFPETSQGKILFDEIGKNRKHSNIITWSENA